MNTRDILRRLKKARTKLQLDSPGVKEENVVYLGDLAQVLVRAKKTSNPELVRELYDAVVFQQQGLEPLRPHSEVERYTRENLDWISRIADCCGIGETGAVGNGVFILGNPKPGKVNKFYREAMGY